MPSITNSLVGFSPLQALALKGTFIEQDGNNTFSGTNTFTGANTFSSTLTATGTTQINTLKVGASGTVGAFNVYPTTALKGSLRILAADSAGDTVTTITNASQAAARTYTVPDAGGAASFVMTEGSQTINGTKTIPAIVTTNLDAGASGTAGTVDIFPTTASKGKIAISAADSAGDTTTAIVNASQAGARTYTIPDAGASASFVMTEGAQTLNGAKTIPAATLTALTFAAGSTIDGDTGIATCSSNACTISKMAGIVTTESLTTAAASSQAITITNTTVAAGDIVLVTLMGGTNTTPQIRLDAVATTNTITVTIFNMTLITTALNGTIIFSFLVIKA